MYFYPKHITQQAVEALQRVGLEFVSGNEMYIPDEDIVNRFDNRRTFTARGVTLVAHQMSFHGHIDPPKTFSTLTGDMEYSGVDQYQCEICGRWCDDRMTISDSNQHDRNCVPQFKWTLGG